MRDARFHNTNGVSEMEAETETIARGNSTTTNVSALTAAITLHTTSNTTNFAKMMKIFQIQLINVESHPHIPSKLGIRKFY